MAGVLVHLMNNVTVAPLWAVTVVGTLVAVPAALSLHRTGQVGRSARASATAR